MHWPVIRKLFLTAVVLIAAAFLPLPSEAAPPKAADSQTAPAPVAAPSTGSSIVAPDANDQTLLYRRIHVPADRIDQWPTGPFRYVPMPAKEFQQLIQAGADQAGDAAQPAAARILDAKYTARLSDDGLLTGQMQLQVSHDATGRVLVPLKPCELALAEPRWIEGTRTRSAEMGIDQDGVLQLVVTQPGQCVCDWSLRGRRESGGELAFKLSLPALAGSHLLLDLPAALRPTVDFGVVHNVEAGKSSSRWHIELGGRGVTRLTLIPTAVLPATGLPAEVRLDTEAAAAPADRADVLRQTVLYDFSPRGLEITARLFLKVGSRPRERLTMDVDPALRLLDARLGEAKLAWSQQPATVHTLARVTLEFPESLAATQRVVELRAVAPLLPGERRKLPGVNPVDVFWQETTATLVVPRPLMLADLRLTDCRQSQLEPLPSAAGDSVSIQYFTPGATVEVLVNRPEPPLRVAAATSLEFTPRNVRGRFVADCSVEEGERFGLTCPLAPSWQIDAVESEPPGAIDDWFVQKRNRRGYLVLSLSQAITPKRPLRLIVTGRLGQSPLAKSFPQTTLRMLDVDTAQWQQRIMALRAREPHQIRVGGDADLNRLTLDKLDGPTRARLSESAGDLIYADDAGADRLEAALLGPAGGHTADIEIALRRGNRLVEESYRISCSPDAGGIDRLLVHVSQVRPEALNWSLADDPTQRLRVRLQTEAQQQEAGFSGGETWEISLERPRTRPFTLIAERSLPGTELVSAALVSVGSFAQQRGVLTVSGNANYPLTIDNRRLKPIPANLPAADRGATLRSAFRYDPTRAVGEGVPALVIARTADPASATAIVWQADYQARHDLDGQVVQAVILSVENRGRRSLNLNLPAGAKLQHVSVDGTRVRQRTDDDLAGVRVDLPAKSRFCTVRLDYSTRESSWGWWRTVRSTLPTIDAPTVAWRGMVWTPPDYRLLTAATAARTPAELRWSDRLFGSLARPALQRPFDPLQGEDWLSATGLDPGAEEARVDAEGFLRRLGHLDLIVGRTLRVGEWLARAAQAGDTRVARVLIDTQALSRVGVQPETPVPAVATTDPVARGAARLLACDLALVVSGDAILVTAADEASFRQFDLVPLHGGAVAWDGGALAQQLLAIDQKGTDQKLADQKSTDPKGLDQKETERSTADSAISSTLAFLPLARWVAGEAVRPLPWVPAVAQGQSDGRPAGWIGTRFEPSAASPASFVVVSNTLWTAAGWSLFLATLVGLWWLYPRRARAWIGLIAALAVAALLLPEGAAPVVTVLLWGAACGGLLSLLHVNWPESNAKLSSGDTSRNGPTAGERGSTVSQPSIRLPASDNADVVPSASPSGSSMPTTATHPAMRNTMLWLLVGFMLLTCGTVGAGDRNDGAAEAQTIYTVLVPISADRKPVGDTWYVPLPLFERLRGRAGAPAAERHGWLTTGVVFRGRMDWNVAKTRLQLTELKAIYDLDVGSRQTQVRIPLGRGLASLLPDGTTLDGRPVEAVWDEQGQALVFDVPELGHSRLELALRPIAQEADANALVQLATPALPTARLELSLPADAPLLEVPTALGEVRLIRAKPTLVAQLGGADRLSIRWPQATSPGQPSVGETDQLLWLKVQPGEVTLETYIKLKGIEGRPRHLRLLADPRLRLLPLSREAAALVQVRVIPGDPQTIVVDPARNATDESVVRLSFLWTDASGLGQMRLPLLMPADSRGYSGWLALSVDPSLRFKVIDPAALAAVDTAELATHWELGAAPLDVAYRLPHGAASWSVATQPRPTTTSMDQAIAVSLAPESADVRLEADLETTGGPLLQYRLRVPPAFVASEVTVLKDDEQRVAHWSQSEAGVSIFLNGPISGSQRLSVRGRWTLPPAAVPVPAFQLDDATSQNIDVAIYRRPGVAVQLGDRDVIQEATDPTAVLVQVGDPLPRSFGRLQGVYHVVNGQAGAMLRVQRVPPRAAAVVVTSIARKEGQWRASVDCQLKMTAGTLDMICFLVPEEFRGPFQISPPQPSELIEIPGSRQRQLVIRLREPVRDQLRLSISSPLTFNPGERVSVPSVTPLDVAPLRRYVVLPKQLEQEKADWELRGLEPEALPQDRDAPPISDQSVVSYRALHDRFQAVLASVAKVEKTPVARLADMRIAMNDTGQFSGLASWDLEPAGLNRMQLTLPEKMALVRAEIGGVPASIVPRGANLWELNLPSDQLPQRIEVVFEGRIAKGKKGFDTLLAPQLSGRSGPLHVERTLWTVYGPAGNRLAPQDAARLVTPVAQQELRLMEIKAILGSVASDESNQVLDTWYAPWMRQLQGCWRDTLRQNPALGPRSEIIPRLVKDSQQQQLEIARRLGTDDVWQAATADAPRAPLATDLWRWSIGPRETPLRFSFLGSQETLAVVPQPAATTDLGWRWMCALAAVGLTTTLWKPRPRQWLIDTAQRWPYLLVVAAGVLAWLLLVPGIVGLLLAGVAGFASWRLVGAREAGSP
ncbi:MAG: hypothetical protein K8T25_18240 [Planctomycetia bacterium]|nr:hypothetical protein [Planctomycetia bacterium]